MAAATATATATATGYERTTQQRATTNTPPPPADNDSSGSADDSRTLKHHHAFPFSIPSSTEAAALRVTRNLSRYTLHYAHFMWIVLFIALIPKRKVALVYMVIMTYVASLYLLVLQTFRGLSVLHKVIDRRLVLSLVVVVAMVELIVNGAALHLVVTLAATTPLVLLHASSWIGEDVVVVAGDCEEAAEFLPVVQQEESHEGNR